MRKLDYERGTYDLGAESAPPDAMGVGDGNGVVAMMEVIVTTPPPILVVGVLTG